MRLRLLNYDILVTYKPGKYLYIADTLSRAFLSEQGLKSDREFTLAIYSVIKNIPMSSERKDQFRSETNNDLQLKMVIEYCINGWPENKRDIPEFVCSYHKIKDSITVSDGLLLFGDKIVVPNSLRSEMLKLLHEGHVGIERCKTRARQLFYWPGINVDIENYNKKCKLCEKYSRKLQKKSLHLFPIPERPWERLGLDIFTYGGKSYLVVFDSFSNWLELIHILDKSIKSVIKTLGHIFCTFGSPDFVTCDNNPFNSYDFKCFSKTWNFKITTRSPHYPRSNGLAEKGVGIAKGIVKKSVKEGDVEIALLQYRNSPLKHIGYSPSQLLMSRICKTKIPICSDLLKPRLCQNVHEKLQNRHNIYNKYYNKNVKNLDPLNPGNDVTVYDHVQKKWDSGKLISKHSLPRSYLVENQSGDIIRRNRVDIKPSLNKFVPSSEYENDLVLSDNTSTVETTAKTNLDLCSDQPQIVSDIPSGSNQQYLETPEAVDLPPTLISPKCSVKKTTRSGRSVRVPNRLNL